MTGQEQHRLADEQLATLEASLHWGSDQASQSLSKWTGKPSIVEIDRLLQLPLTEATDLLSSDDNPICFCAADIHGPLVGHFVLAFDDTSGWALADILLNRPPGSTSDWSDMAVSAAKETANILCCAYSNALSRRLTVTDESRLLMPTPPQFNRDYPASLLEFALMDQAMNSDVVVLATTRFEIDGTPLSWTLLFVPTTESLARLPSLLTDTDPAHEAG